MSNESRMTVKRISLRWELMVNGVGRHGTRGLGNRDGQPGSLGQPDFRGMCLK